MDLPPISPEHLASVCPEMLRIMDAQAAQGRYPSIIILALAPSADPTAATEARTTKKTTAWQGSFFWRRYMNEETQQPNMRQAPSMTPGEGRKRKLDDSAATR